MLPAPTGLLKGLSNELAATKAQWNKVRGVLSVTTMAKEELGELQKLGPTVGAEDVIESAGRIVGNGMSPQEMAAELANLPQGGQAIAGWLADTETKLGGQQTQLEAIAEGLRHQMAVQATHVLLAHDMHAKAQAAPMGGPLAAGSPQASPEALAGGPPPTEQSDVEAPPTDTGESPNPLAA